MPNTKVIALVLIAVFFLTVTPLYHAEAAPVQAADITKTLTSPSLLAGEGSLIEKLFSFLFEKVLSPFNSSNTTVPSTVPIPKPETPSPAPVTNAGILRGKVIVVDPGHGGSNPGAVANGLRESDNNLSISLKLRDKLTQAGAKVIMTRDSDRTVAPEGSSLGQELVTRLEIADANHADMFVSVHSNDNVDTSLAGTMTFYPSGKSNDLAFEVQNAIVKETGSIDKGTSAATFHVLRNAQMPSILIETGFLSNVEEAAHFKTDDYRQKMAQGIFNGIVNYFNNK